MEEKKRNSIVPYMRYKPLRSTGYPIPQRNANNSHIRKCCVFPMYGAIFCHAVQGLQCHLQVGFSHLQITSSVTC